MMTIKLPNNDKALAAFIARKVEIDEMLARLQELSDDHFNVAPDEVNWAHVGDIGWTAEHLRELTDRAFSEGEYAE